MQPTEGSWVPRDRGDHPDIASLSTQAARKRMEKQFQENAARPLFSGSAVSLTRIPRVRHV